MDTSDALNEFESLTENFEDAGFDVDFSVMDGEVRITLTADGTDEIALQGIGGGGTKNGTKEP